MVHGYNIYFKSSLNR